MHFIVGHPRSGTHLLATLLNAAGLKVAMHETFVELSPGEAFIALATDYYEGLIGADAIKDAVVGCRVPAGIKIDSSWKNTWVLPVLLELYPDARVLHLARDPRRNVIACQNLGYYGRSDAHAEFPIMRRWLQAMPSIHRPDWEALSTFGRNCAFWTESHRLILETRPVLAERYTMLRLEDISHVADVAGIFDFFQVAPPSAAAIEQILAKTSNPQAKVKERMKAYPGNILLPAFEECSSECQNELRQICAPMATQLGYRL
jgi:hypothetical protein